MPHFSESGNDTYICQRCARVFDSVEQPSQWRPDITGNSSAGNVCPACVRSVTGTFVVGRAACARVLSENRALSLHEVESRSPSDYPSQRRFDR